MRGTLIFASLAAVFTLALSAQAPRQTAAPARAMPFHIVEATIPQMRAAMASGRLTSRALVSQYLVRLGTFGYNRSDPRPDPREARFEGRPALQTGGSSSGIGTAANLWAANVGTDTGGSVISPSNANMLVGIRPTIGRISRYGVIPITADHDTAGPMTRTVTDAAIMLGALESPRPDPNDPATTTCTPPPGRDYTRFLRAGGLKGARVGIPRAYYYDRITLTGHRPARAG